MSEQPYDLLRAKIEEIFQIDRGDLDFGIYRILRIKSAEMRRFLGEDLPRKIEERFGEVRTATAMRARRELQEKREALLDMGQSEKQISATPVIMELEERLRNEGPDGEEVARAIYSDLFNFFRRYYRDGDFISERRYGGEDKYMLSHTGEEVRLHWANYDQYYIKSSENFSRYVFLADDGRRKVVFRVARAETEQNDNKDQNGRRLLVADADDLRDGNPIEIDENIGTLTVHFAFKEPSRELNGKRKSGKATQADCDGGNVTKILASLPEEWKAMLNKSLGGDPVRTLLEKHVGAFSARNRFDYFIHKDLGAFLRRELDFFLKNEVMILSDVADASPMVIRSWMNRIRLTQEVGNYIIDMLAQLEEFQKKLWLKKKFVLETNWLAAWRFLSDDLRARVLENEAQTAEWKVLYGTTEPAPHILVDTKHFDSDFKEALLSHVGESHDIDDICDGVLVNGDNFHGLRLLENRCREQVKCIHIDPPYNTNTNGFLYKNGYKHSSWMTMMENCLSASLPFIGDASVMMCHIDENEQKNLSCIFDALSAEDLETIIWNKSHPVGGSNKVSTQHEYVVLLRQGKLKLIKMRKSADKILEKFASLMRKRAKSMAERSEEFSGWMKDRKDDFLDGEDVFKHMDENGPYQSVHMGAPEQRTDEKFFVPIIHPETGKPCPVPKRGWSNTPEFMDSLRAKGLLIFGEDETTQPRRKVYLSDSRTTELSSLITNA
ncbi:MAG: site-specific DNA-methyltransferase, partial [Alphaproteobacteria bacterium]|nr:site-specific DNA-methyltransferase [Alphaproteobacteria bacterium]